MRAGGLDMLLIVVIWPTLQVAAYRNEVSMVKFSMPQDTSPTYNTRQHEILINTHEPQYHPTNRDLKNAVRAAIVHGKYSP